MSYDNYSRYETTYVPLERDLVSDLIQPGKAELFQIGDYYPLPYNEITRIKISKYLEKERLVPYLPYEAKDLTPQELNQLNYLILSLDGYSRQKNYFPDRKNELIPLIMLPEGSKTLKRMRLKSFLKSNNSKLIETPDWWDEVKDYYIDDIGEIYNYNYAMFWEAQDEQDYLLSQNPVNEDPEYVKKFEECIKSILEQCIPFETVEAEEILLRVSASKALDHKKSVPMYNAKYRNLEFNKVRGPGKRVLITTGPGQGRDAIINDICDLNTIQYINENVRSFLETNFSKFLLLGNAENSKRKYFRRCAKSKSFFCRDIKKEGITKPKYILKILLKALHERYPECDAFSYYSFYDGPWFEGDKGNRGHGLGMANELTTLMQIVLYFLTNRELGEEGSYVASSQALFLNDDAIIFFKEELDLVEDFIDMDFFLCEKLGIIAQKDKSFFSEHCAVFCELYYARISKFINDKESYLLREQNIISRSSNILEAKFLLGNLKGNLEQTENILKFTFSKLGYEFYENEISMPITFGGIRPMKLRGTDFSLKYLEELSDIKSVFKCYTANKHKRLWNFNKFIKNYQSPILTLYPKLAFEDPELLAKIGLGSEFDLACTFFRPSKEHKFHSSVKKLFRKRQEIFKSTDGNVTEEFFIQDYIENSLSNVYVEDKYIEKYIEVNLFTYKNFRDPYQVKNPLTSFLNLVGLKNLDIPKTRWGLYSTDASLLHEKSTFARARTMNTLSLIDRFEEDSDIDILVFPKNKEDIPIFMESYPKPFLTSELVRLGNKLPIPKFRKKELIFRKEVYGEYLQFYHILLFQTYGWKTVRDIIIFEKNIPFEYDYEFWDTILNKVQQDKEGSSTEDITSSSSSDDDDDYHDYVMKITSDFLQTVNLVGLPKEKEEIEIEPMVLGPIEDDVYELSEDDSHIYDITLDVGEAKKESDDEIPEFVPKSLVDEVEAEMLEEMKNNIFFKLHGELEEGDESVYGSIGWVKWFVRQHPVDLIEYLQADADLELASRDVMAMKRSVMAASNIMTLTNEKENLESMREKSWIAHYYYEYIHEEEEDVEVEYFDQDDFFKN